jgi:hypothetical protein
VPGVEADWRPYSLDYVLTPPGDSFDDVDHVVEADIELPSGMLA